jgi:hypothetical protein
METKKVSARTDMAGPMVSVKTVVVGTDPNFYLL